MKCFSISTKVLIYDIEECEPEQKKLIDAAKAATGKAYAPYSGYHVGAAALLANGEIIAGNNQENAAYPSGICAERTTLFYANASRPDVAVVAIAIIAYHNGDFVKDVCTPCGACRQVMLEVENRSAGPVKVIMCSRDKAYVVESVKDLLPLSFGKEALS